MTNDELEAIRARDADYNDIFEQQANMSPHIAHRLVAWPVHDRRALLAEVDKLREWQRRAVVQLNLLRDIGDKFDLESDAVNALIEEAGHE